MNKNILLQPYSLSKNLHLKNRIVMAPMTRAMTDDNLVPTDLMTEYYARRADAGLIITEGSIIREDSIGLPHTAALFNEAQKDGWQKVTAAVHKNNGLIFLQLWHVGRVTHPNYLKGKLPISASETKMEGRLYRSNLQLTRSRAASLLEIQELIEDYAKSAKLAMEAGFDGVEIHGANGYLIDQFLHYDTNHREDEYGGNAENMSRFALEIVHAVGQVVGFDRVGLRLSPGAYLNEIVGDVRDAEVFKLLLNRLNAFPIAYIHTGNFDDSVLFPELNNMTMTAFLRQYFRGNLIACGGYNYEKGNAGLANNEFDLLALGRSFIANPDLINKLKKKLPLTEYHADMLNTLY